MGHYTKKFSKEQERAILSLYFTNPFGEVSFVYPSRDFGPEEQAALAARYSRSDIPYQGKFLKLLEKESIDLATIDALVRNPDFVHINALLGDAAKKDSATFHTRWSLGMSAEEKDE